jgi:hypothetical protein
MAQPSIILTAINLKDTTHRLDRELMLIIADKAVLHSGLLAKYFPVFFRMSRSSVMRHSSDVSRAFSAERSILSEAWGLSSK